MLTGDVLVRGSIWLSLLGWSLAEWWRLQKPRSASHPSAASLLSGERGARAAWSFGAVMAVIHVLVAFHLRHGWSHASAVAETARQTEEALGVALGAGVYVNYLFIAVWLADAVWWWASPVTFGVRPASLDRAIRLFLLFIFVNGAIVFPKGPIRFAGIVLVAGLVAAWYRGRLTTGVPKAER